MLIWQLILSGHNVEPLYTTEIIPVEFYIICIYVSYMHGCILSYEREREIRPRKYLATYSHHSWFHIPNYAYKKKNQKEQCHPYCHTYRKFIQKLEWAGLCYAYISIEFQHFFFREKLESSKIIWFMEILSDSRNIFKLDLNFLI